MSTVWLAAVCVRFFGGKIFAIWDPMWRGHLWPLLAPPSAASAWVPTTDLSHSAVLYIHTIYVHNMTYIGKITLGRGICSWCLQKIFGFRSDIKTVRNLKNPKKMFLMNWLFQLILRVLLKDKLTNKRSKLILCLFYTESLNYF